MIRRRRASRQHRFSAPGARLSGGRRLVTAALLVATTLVLVPAARASAGALDPSFGAGGRVLAGPGTFMAAAFQPDGRLVVAGTDGADLLVVRFLPNGQPDPSFGGDGRATKDLGGIGDVGNALVVQSDGAIVVAGTNGSDFGLARYLSGGELDPSFGTNGVVTTDVRGLGPAGNDLPAVPDVATAIIGLDDGRLVVAGHGGNRARVDGSADSDFVLARYLSDGSLDPTFGSGGIVTTDLGYQDRINALVLQGSRYVAAGTGHLAEGRVPRDFIVARYTDLGLLDTTFGPGGVVRTDLGDHDIAEDIVALPDGSLVAAGRSAGNIALVRYSADGAVDASFGTSGRVITDLGGFDGAFAGVADAGRLLVAGSSRSRDVAVVRYSPSGAVDTSFGDNGVVTTDFDPTVADIANALAVDGNGRAVVAGASGEAVGGHTAILARYLTADGDSLPRPPRITLVNGDAESPASGIDGSPEIVVSGLTYGQEVVLLDGGAELARRRVADASEIFNQNSISEAVLSGDRSHSLTAVAVDEAGGASPASLPFVYILRETETDSAPQVSGLDPSAGPTMGGTQVTIFGSGLAARDIMVKFGTTRAQEVRVLSDNELVVVSPFSPEQTAVDVTVSTTRGTSLVVPASRYTYGAGAWAKAGALSSCGPDNGCGSRSLHTATLLPSGGVLVAGGSPDFFISNDGSTQDFTQAKASTQLYTGATWRPAASLVEARLLHTATLLDPPGCSSGTLPAEYPCGAVLIAGGETSRGVATGSAELYGPLADQWTDAGAMRFPRFSHSATLLADGRVLVAGGVVSEQLRGATPVAVAEIYDPATRQWTSVPPLVPPRANHSATLLANGKVLVAGGLTGLKAESGVTSVQTTSLVALFDPRSNSWESTGALAVARFDHSATLLEGPACSRAPAMCGKVLVAGGDAGAPSWETSAELYDVASGTWSATQSLLDDPRSGHTATLLPNGTVLLAGGGPRFPAAPRQAIPRSASVFDPATSQWKPTSAMDSRRGGHTSTLLSDGSVLAAGGYKALLEGEIFTTGTDTSERYRPAPDLRLVQPGVLRAGVAQAMTLEGTGLSTATEVTFARGAGLGAEEAKIGPGGFSVLADSRITVNSPALAAGVKSVGVVNPGGTSLSDPAVSAHRVVVKGSPATPRLIASVSSGSSVQLEFRAVDDGAGVGPARSYVVKQATEPLGTSDWIDSAALLCKTTCDFTPPETGTVLQLAVTDLTPGTTYHFAIAATNDVGLIGEFATAVVTTSLSGGSPCPVTPPAANGQVRYPGGQYSLVGLPHATIVQADSALYGWFDLGAGGSYSNVSAAQPVEGGRGYWAWFRCPSLVEMTAGTSSVQFDLGAYHASMVGNPSARSPARLTGPDFSARWNPELNSGAGGYEVSRYQEPQTLSVGDGIWTFSYAPTRVMVDELTSR